jgi:hypothetical protein
VLWDAMSFRGEAHKRAKEDAPRDASRGPQKARGAYILRQSSLSVKGLNIFV